MLRGMKPAEAPAGTRITMAFGFAALAFGLCYEVTQVLDVLGVFRAPWGMFAIVLPSLFLAWSYAAYATLNSFVYPMQLVCTCPRFLQSAGCGSSRFLPR
jgi:hypothetical protein